MHPTVAEIRSLAKLYDDEGLLRRFVNLRLLEGVPAAYFKRPSDYELVRDVIASSLNIKSHCISLIGSARFGFSYTARKELRPFTAGRSDLDFLVCNEGLFDECAADASRFIDIASRLSLNREVFRDKLILANMDSLKRSMPRGFVDPDKVPNLPRYPATKRLHDTSDEIKAKYKRAVLACRVRFRVYRDWDAAVAQNLLNLKANLEEIIAIGHK